MMKKAKAFRRLASVTGAAALALCSIQPAWASAADTARIMGDITNDMHVDLNDAISTMELYNLSMAEITDNKVSMDNYAGDVDMNGQIDLDDSVGILTYYNLSSAELNPLWADLRQKSYVDSFTGNDKAVPFELTGLYVEIGCASAKPGEEVTIPVYIAGVQDMAGLQYRMETPDGLTMTGLQPKVTDSENSMVVNSDWGAFVWANERGRNMTVTDGKIIGTYTYRIPETAKAGDYYLLNTDTSYSEFVTVNGSSIDAYQYTLVSGCITVE